MGKRERKREREREKRERERREKWRREVMNKGRGFACYVCIIYGTVPDRNQILFSRVY